MQRGHGEQRERAERRVFTDDELLLTHLRARVPTYFCMSDAGRVFFVESAVTRAHLAGQKCMLCWTDPGHAELIPAAGDVLVLVDMQTVTTDEHNVVVATGPPRRVRVAEVLETHRLGTACKLILDGF